MRPYLIPIAALALSACSTANDVAINSEYQRSAAQAESARMQAISEIARQGESGVVAAALLMQQQGNSGPRAPVNSGDREAGIISSVAPLIVGLGQVGASIYASDADRDIAITQSNNGRDVAINQSDNDAIVTMQTNDTMSDIAGATIVTTTDTDVVCVTDDTYSCD